MAKRSQPIPIRCRVVPQPDGTHMMEFLDGAITLDPDQWYVLVDAEGREILKFTDKIQLRDREEQE